MRREGTALLPIVRKVLRQVLVDNDEMHIYQQYLHCSYGVGYRLNSIASLFVRRRDVHAQDP